MSKVPWEVLYEAWLPYLGHVAAEERARNAAQLCMVSRLSEGKMVEIFTNALLLAKSPTYGGHRLNGSTIADAVNDAIQALADAAVQGAQEGS